jgi:hypothetical protein
MNEAAATAMSRLAHSMVMVDKQLADVSTL